MKIKEIVLREQQLGQTNQQVKITDINPTTGKVTATPVGGGQPIEVNTNELTKTPQGYEATVPLPKEGDLITLTPATGQSNSTTTSTTSSAPTTSSTSTPSTATPTTSSTSTSNPPQVEEIDDDEDLNDFSDNELIQTATHKGMEDSLEFDDDGVLINRNEIIDLLQKGQEFGGDPTDKIISDVKDDEYDQLLEKIRHLSGL